jgi:hypothetical protein
MNNLDQKIDIEEGTISFWIKENQIDFSDSLLYSLVNVSHEKGAIFILKDTDKKIKFFHVYMGNGRTDVNWDCSKLNNNERHMVTVTWSLKDKAVKLYVDGELVGENEIKY